MKCLGEIFDYPDNFCLCGRIFQIFRYFAINDFNISTSVLLFRIISLSSYAVLALPFDPVRNKHRVFTRYAHTFHEKISFLAVLLFHTLSFSLTHPFYAFLLSSFTILFLHCSQTFFCFSAFSPFSHSPLS